jgi:peptide/nickel transport system permease protein
MLSFAMRRLLAIVPMLLIVSFVIFGLVTLIPGDAAVTLAGGIDAQPESVEQIRQELKLDEPFLVQYVDWLGGVVRLDFGDSLYSDEPIVDEVAERLPVTLGLAGLVFVLALAAALLFGITGGLRPGSLVDRVLLLLSSASISMPGFWVALLLVVIFAVELQWLPPFGYTEFAESPVEWFRRMILPASALALSTAAVVARQLRGGLADTMQSAFIRTAWAKGGSTRQVVVGHALKNSAIPAVTVLGLQVGVVLGGSVLIEQIFTIPGLGTYLLDAVNTQDLPAVQAVAVLFVIIQVGVSLVVDITYGFLNPKVRAA